MVHQSADGSKMGGPPESGTTVPLDKTGLLMEGERGKGDGRLVRRGERDRRVRIPKLTLGVRRP